MKTAFSNYDPAYYRLLFAVEERHFWFRARRRVISALVKQIVVAWPPGYRVLEVGCGTGNLLRSLQTVCREGMVVGMDLFSEGLQYARRRTDCILVQGDVQKLPFRSGFDLVGVFDVLEHLEDDRKFLQDLHSILNPRGWLLLTVPAQRSLWSYFDEASRHYRRYQPDELTGILIESGYRIDYISPYMTAVLPGIWLRRRLSSGLGLLRPPETARSELRIVPGFNRLLDLLLIPEAGLIARRRRLPGGSSLIALAEKV